MFIQEQEKHENSHSWYVPEIRKRKLTTIAAYQVC